MAVTSAPTDSRTPYWPGRSGRRAPAAAAARPRLQAAHEPASSARGRSSGCSARAASTATTFRFPTLIHDEPVTMVNHPEHVKSLLARQADLAPSLTGESPLRPIVGPNSTLTALGARHMRQRKLLLPLVPRRRGRPLRGDDHRGRRARGRLLDARRRGRAGLAHAGRHARRDHGRHLRHRGASPERGTPEHDLRRAVRAARRPLDAGGRAARRVRERRRATSRSASPSSRWPGSTSRSTR